MKEKYRPLEKEILADLADLSLIHGPVEIQLTEEDQDGNFVPAFIVRAAPDGVLRGLVEDDRVADLSLEYGELHITPAPCGLDDAFEGRHLAQENARTVAEKIQEGVATFETEVGTFTFPPTEREDTAEQ